ncbi:hypothetical protein DFH07DRAFT_960937 [Mycena maculata]|uniref:Uncharacterized protein n=1 Tax=Mycena maculata TaxID=230809 RepID=A0AAD7IVQ8_9AGAR|nr:hypothetical protein DFH07DRAFT_960937 [Mycena maculata]
MSLLSQGPLTSISTNPLMCPAPNRSTLHENDYPKVKYLQRSKWTKAVDKRRGISGGDIISRNSLAFIEDSDGRAPTDAKITEMRKWCYSFFFELQKKRTAPAVWGQVSLSAQGDFRAGAECEFFNLALGDGHWKADQLATIVFPSWNGTHGTGAKVKEELISGDEEDDDEVIEVSKSRKRASAAPGAPAAKRLRPDSTLSPSQSKKAKKDGTRKKRKNPLLGRTPETSTELLTPLQPSTEPIAPVPLESVPAPTVDSIPSSTTTVSLNTLDSSLPATSAALSVDPALVAPRTTPTASPHRIPIPPPVATVSSLVQTVDAPPNTTGPIPLAPSPSKLRSPIVPALPDRSAGFAAVAGSSSLNTVPTKKKKWNPSGTSTTARALCAMWYKNQHGSKADAESFKTYWDKLSPEEKNPWITREANAKSAVAALNWLGLIIECNNPSKITIKGASASVERGQQGGRSASASVERGQQGGTR